MIEFQMPKMDHTSEECTITQWLINVGDIVVPGQIVMNIETNKAILDIEVNFSGKLKEIIVHEGETVPVNIVVALFEEVWT